MPQEIHLKNILPHNVERHRRQSQIRSNGDAKHRRNFRNATILGPGNSFGELPELDSEMVSFSTIQEWISGRVQKACGCSCRRCGLYVRSWSHSWSTTSQLKSPKVVINSLTNKFINSPIQTVFLKRHHYKTPKMSSISKPLNVCPPPYHYRPCIFVKAFETTLLSGSS